MTDRERGDLTVAFTCFCVAAILLVVLCSGCSHWRQVTVRGLWVAQVVGVQARVAIEDGDLCKAARDKCRANNTLGKTSVDKCRFLEDCKRKRRTAISALKTHQHAVSAGASMLGAADKPTAAAILSAVVRSARDVCGALRAWGKAPKACGYLP